MAHGNGNGTSVRWAVGTVILVVAGWLTILSVTGSNHASKDEVQATESRVTKRLERMEDKLDRILEQGRVGR